ncbi:MAG: His/Gly/Thr/Pro-type tRNA ligase C-terminal domain-containing protein, partial [Actinomycetota bacterium]
DDERARVLEVAAKIKTALAGNLIRVKVDDRDQHRPGYKFSEWELKGVPLRIEVGPRDVDSDQVVIASRFNGEKESRSTSEAIASIAGLLDQMQKDLYQDALAFREDNTHEIENYDSFVEGVSAESGLWVGAWCGDEACEQKVIADTKANIRVVPLEQEDPGAGCAVCGRPGTERATWAKSY